MKIKTLPPIVKTAQKATYLCLYEEIKKEILAHRMQYGDQLPSIRTAAKQLGVSVTTIENAYQRLCMEGLICAKAQRGYFVDVSERQAAMHQKIMQAAPHEEQDSKWMDLRTSSMDASLFDGTLWMHYLKDVLAQERWIMSYGDPQGEWILRKALVQYGYAMRGVLSKEDQIVVGANFQTLLYLIGSLYEGKRVIAMEESGFVQGEQVLRDLGFTIRYLPCDDAGIRMNALKAQDIGLLYVNSASCGINKKAMPQMRRSELLAYAKAHHILILEDDHNGELRYQSRMMPAMQGMDMGHQIIYLRSFSKLLLPSLRMSYAVLNDSLYQRYLRRKPNYHPSNSKIEQLAFAQYLRDGHMEKQIHRMRRRYEEKSTALWQLWRKRLPNESIVLDESALRFLYTPKQDVQAYIDCAAQASILIQRHGAAIALSFAAYSTQELQHIVTLLIDAWQEAGLVG